MSMPSLRGMIRRDSCLQHDARNSFGMAGNVFWRRTCTKRTSSSILWKFKKYGISFLRTKRGHELERTLRILQFHHRDLQGSFQPGILPFKWRELIRKIVWLSSRGIKSQKCISINSIIFQHFSVGKRVWRPRYVPVQAFLLGRNGVDPRRADGRFSGRSWDVAVHWRAQFSQNLEMVDAKIASAVKKIITNPYFKKRVNQEEQKAQMQDRFLHGRHIACMTYEYFRETGAHEAVLDFTDLFCITSLVDDIQDFDTRCDQALSSTREVPKNSILESLCEMRIQESDQLRTVLAMNEQEMHQDRSKPNWQKFKTCTQITWTAHEISKSEVKELEQEYWLELRKEKNVSVEKKTRECYQWTAEEQCSKGDACSFRHDDGKREKTAQSSSLGPRSKAQHDGGKPSKVLVEGEIRKRAGNYPVLWLKWHPPVCQHHKTESRCKFSEKCVHTEVTGSPVRSRRKVAEKDV